MEGCSMNGSYCDFQIGVRGMFFLPRVTGLFFTVTNFWFSFASFVANPFKTNQRILNHTLCARNAGLSRINFDGGSDRPSKTLKDRFTDVMAVSAVVQNDVQVAK